MCKENNLCLRFIYAKLSIALQYFQDICNIEHSSEDHQALKIRYDPKYISIVNILTFLFSAKRAMYASCACRTKHWNPLCNGDTPKYINELTPHHIWGKHQLSHCGMWRVNKLETIRSR